MTHSTFPAGAADIELAPLGPAVPPAQLLGGEPIASGLRIHAADGASSGIWEVTPGEFVSIKDDVTEVMHFIHGAGSIEHPDGTVTVIEPGAVVTVGPRWRGTWRVTATARKFYAAFTATS